MGVEHVIDYRSENFKDRVLEITDGNGADVIIDSLGGKALKDSFGCLAEFGRLISYGFSKAAPGTKKNIFKDPSRISRYAKIQSYASHGEK